MKGLPDELTVDEKGDLIRIGIGDAHTGWISREDSFFKRISDDRLNPFFKIRHLTREIEVKNILDKGIGLLNSQKYVKSISCFDEVLHYDGGYIEALINKSHALFGQAHYVKSLRFYKKAVNSGYGGDVQYYKLLLKKSGEERENFPKIKRNIYAGDEAVAEGNFDRALVFYKRALVDTSRFKDKILFKLFNKMAFVLIKLHRFDEALASFDESIKADENDLAYFGRGYCKHRLGMDCVDSLRQAQKIDEKCLLEKARIFNELGYYGDALDAFNEFLNNHFALDSSFKSAVCGKIIALDALDLDSSFERGMLSYINEVTY